MAVMKMDFSPDFLNNQLLNVLLQLLGSEPTAVQGKIFLDTAEGALKVSLDGGSWSTVAMVSDLNEAGVSMESVMDTLGTGALVGGTNVTLAYDDAANAGQGTITISASADGGDAATLDGNTAANLRDRATHTGTQVSATIGDFDTAVNALVQSGIDSLVDAAPGALDTLNELAAALGDDPDFATTVNTALAARAQTYSETYGDGAATSFGITHNLNTRDIVVSVQEVATGEVVIVPWNTDSVDQITITHTTTPTAGQYRATVVARPGSS